MEERIINRINKEIGSDIKNLYKSKILINAFKQDIINIESKLNWQNDSTSNNLKTALISSENTSKEIQEESVKLIKFEKELTKNIKFNDQKLGEIADKLDKTRKLEHLLGYFHILEDIQSISNELKSSISKDDVKTIGLYLSLCGEYNSTNNIVGRLQGMESEHLKNYAFNTASYWHEILTTKFSTEFDGLLKTKKWLNFGENIEVLNPPKDSLSKLVVVAEHLFLLKPPGQSKGDYVMITPSIICPPISIPIQLLIKPFRQRFQFHFTGTRQTNRLDKPEWYFTKILKWVQENQQFVSQSFQSVAIKSGLSDLNCRLEFARGIVQLGIEKLCVDIEEINKDESHFAHLLDEVLSFEHELRDLIKISYLSGFPTPISVLTQAQYMMKWISIEEKFITDKMDTILTTGTPWEFIDPGSFEELKIPKCADQFIRLLDAIRERYCCLPQPGHQLQFLQLQLELIDNFRQRLVQLHNSTVNNVSTTKILNALNYLNSVLREWGENVHYLHLHAALVGPNAEEINSVFDKPVEELEHWQKKLVKELALKIVDDIKARSMPYRHDGWVTMSEQNSKEPFILSFTAGEMFQIMVTNLHNLEMELSTNLFNITLRLISSSLDSFFIDSMVMNTKFSLGGAAQFQFDMCRNLFALFGQYARRPELLFKKIHNTCILLTLPRGSALLLHQTLKGVTNMESTTSALKEVGVSNISSLMAVEIIERRIDFCT